jgi:hypothetical protein
MAVEVARIMRKDHREGANLTPALSGSACGGTGGKSMARIV